ncbi:hypothetical protein AB0C14_06960 [Microbispora hainanensis]|uniref:hypothetical protein n=1 Tax=Microbispora hainanensis TaxID=568844 RepID=UPI0033FAD787
MPGIDHEMPIELIRNRPETALELLHCVTGMRLPPFAAARVEAADRAVLSAVAHSDEAESEQVLEAMLVGLGTLDEDRVRLYLNHVFGSLPEVTAKRLEEMVSTIQDFDYLGEKYFSHWVDKGREEGREEGRAEGEINAILAVLDARGLEISDEARERIRGCEDLSQLGIWVRRAATVASADDLFA